MSLQTRPGASGRLRVLVLMGGSSSEREVSLKTGRMIVGALDPAKYDVAWKDTREMFSLSGGTALGPLLLASGDGALEPSGVKRAPESSAADRSLVASPENSSRPDVVFLALHGKGGEDGTVQGMLELLGLPYTGSGVLASALAMDKVMSKRVFKAAGIPVIEGIYVTRKRGQAWTEADFLAERQQVDHLLGYPVFVKPNAGGSTCGCTLVTDAEALFPAVQEALKFDETALIERYVKGMEITVGVLDSPGEPLLALPVIEIVPKSEYYDYESKYAEGGSDHIIPARLPESVLREAQEIAMQCHAALGCSGVSRTDLIVADNSLVVLETNTLPGMTPTSLLPQAAEAAGISFSALLDRLIQAAQQKQAL